MMRKSFILGVLLAVVVGGKDFAEAKATDKPTTCENQLVGDEIKYTLEHEALKTASRYIVGLTGEYGKLLNIEQSFVHENGLVSVDLEFTDHHRRTIPLTVVVDPAIPQSKLLISRLSNNGRGRVYVLKRSVSIDSVHRLDELNTLIQLFDR